MSQDEGLVYQPATNGEAMRLARLEKGLEKEIAVLRVRLGDVVASKTPDDGLILAIINTLGRALLAQARLRGADPEAASERTMAMLRRLSLFLQPGSMEAGDEHSSACEDSTPELDR